MNSIYDYLMEITLDNYCAHYSSLKPDFDTVKKFFYTDEPELYFTENECTYLLYNDGDEPVAVASLCYQKKCTFIYDVFVDENIRNHGIGTFFIRSLLKDYFEYHDEPLRLHVTGKNAAAFHLYISCGFKIIESSCDDT